MVAGVLFISFVVDKLPWQASFGLYTMGVAITHIFLFTHMVETKGPTDFKAYTKDSGIFLTVFLWPAFLFVVLMPNLTEYLTRKTLGIAKADRPV